MSRIRFSRKILSKLLINTWDEDGKKDASEYELFDGQDIYALIVLPIISNHRLNGYIGLDNPEHSIARMSLRLLTSVGGHIGCPLYIRQILMNIGANAVKYTGPGGMIEISCVEKPQDHDRTLFCFTVSDTGIGMSEEFQEHVFEAFAQEKEPEKKQKDLTGKKILLAEDNELNAEIATFLLEQAGMTVTVAQNGQEAVELFQKSEPGNYDLILMDIMMPVMNGYEAAMQIRKMNHADASAIPVIAMSANAFPDDIAEAKRAGMNEHLAKPADGNRMLEAIEEYIR